jgi:hypothetical protein
MKCPSTSPSSSAPASTVERELRLLVLDGLGRLEEVRLVADAVAAHRLDLELGGIRVRRPLHLAHDRRAERVVRIERAGVGDLGGEPVEHLVGVPAVTSMPAASTKRMPESRVPSA